MRRLVDENLLVVQVWLVTRLLFAVIAVALAVTGRRSLESVVAQWDVAHFLLIAREGYADPQEMAFFPGLPLVLRGFMEIGLSPVLWGSILALACSLMHRPPVLFLDEPTSGVDPITRREFWTHINGLARKGVTIMVTTHFMDEAEYCDRVAMLSRARLIALDTPDALKRAAANVEHPDPTMEDAFIHLVESADREMEAAA